MTDSFFIVEILHSKVESSLTENSSRDKINVYIVMVKCIDEEAMAPLAATEKGGPGLKTTPAAGAGDTASEQSVEPLC